MQLEDQYTDVLDKARQGLGLELRQLAEESGLSIQEINQLLGGNFHEASVRALAPVLGLNADALCALGNDEIIPEAGEIPATLTMLISNYEGIMDVNTYLVADPLSKKALLFDTGCDDAQVISAIEARAYLLQGIYLTHTHRDHLACLPRLKNHFRCPIHVHSRATPALQDIETLDWGDTFTCGSLSIQTRQTTGHAADGTTYVIEGLSRPVAIVGDTIFAASMGGGKISYREALQTNEKNLFTLSDDTLVCPGHGPMTSIGFEKRWNPFYTGNTG